MYRYSNNSATKGSGAAELRGEKLQVKSLLALVQDIIRSTTKQIRSLSALQAPHNTIVEGKAAGIS